MATNNRTRNACIATALSLVALLAATPIASADDEPQNGGNGLPPTEDCFDINPWSMPPSVHVSPIDCIPGQ